MKAENTIISRQNTLLRAGSYVLSVAVNIREKYAEARRIGYAESMIIWQVIVIASGSLRVVLSKRLLG